MDEGHLPDLVPPSPVRRTTPRKKVCPGTRRSDNPKPLASAPNDSNKTLTTMDRDMKTDSSDEEIKLDYSAHERRSSSMEESDFSPASKYGHF